MTEESRPENTGSLEVCLVVPCYNEEHRLNAESFREFVARKENVQLLFIDDGSRDGTLAVLEHLRQSCEDRIGVLALKQNVGKAEAVRRGILHALDTFSSRAVGYWDADLATPLAAVDSFSKILGRCPGVEIVLGARVKLLGRRVERRVLRHYLGRVFATAASTVLKLPIYDTQCGAKLFRVRAETRRIFDRPFLSRWVFDVELIARYLILFRGENRSAESAIYEYPLETWVDIAGSKVRPTDFFVALWDVLRIYRRYMT
jgi:glycosyltransferase involved in cell wall biosynthesis